MENWRQYNINENKKDELMVEISPPSDEVSLILQILGVPLGFILAFLLHDKTGKRWDYRLANNIFSAVEKLFQSKESKRLDREIAALEKHIAENYADEFSESFFDILEALAHDDDFQNNLKIASEIGREISYYMDKGVRLHRGKHPLIDDRVQQFKDVIMALRRDLKAMGASDDFPLMGKLNDLDGMHTDLYADDPDPSQFN